MDKKKIDFWMAMAAGLVITVILTVIDPQSVSLFLHRLCNGLFVSAVLILGIGLLIFSRNKGTFDVAVYSIKSVFFNHYPAASLQNARADEEDFVAYSERKAKERRSAAGFLWAGLVYMVLAFAVLCAHYLA